MIRDPSLPHDASILHCDGDLWWYAVFHHPVLDKAVWWVILRFDGDVETSPGYPATEGARLFWESAGQLGLTVMGRLAAAEAGNGRLRADLAEAHDAVRELHGTLSGCTLTDEHPIASAPEDVTVAHLGDSIGYGAMMHAAGRMWARSLRDYHGKDISDGAFAVGPCNGTVRAALKHPAVRRVMGHIREAGR